MAEVEAVDVSVLLPLLPKSALLNRIKSERPNETREQPKQKADSLPNY
jgi:hypothetical protein